MLYYFCPVDYISIHALLAESDVKSFMRNGFFLISIHALLAESDVVCGCPRVDFGHFYPRSPCGERLRSCPASSPRRYFYPRSPCGERLKEVEKLSRVTVISIHALLAESDGGIIWWDFVGRRFLSTLSLRRATCSFCPADSQGRHFYPRSPCGERLSKNAAIGNPTLISIHALLAESDGK